MDWHRLRWGWRRVPFGDKINAGVGLVSLAVAAAAIVMSAIALLLTREQSRLAAEQTQLAQRQTALAERQAEQSTLQNNVLKRELQNDAIVDIGYNVNGNRLTLSLFTDALIPVRLNRTQLIFRGSGYRLQCDDHLEQTTHTIDRLAPSAADMPPHPMMRYGTVDDTGLKVFTCAVEVRNAQPSSAIEIEYWTQAWDDRRPKALNPRSIQIPLSQFK